MLCSCSNKLYNYYEKYGDISDPELKGDINSVCKINYEVDTTFKCKDYDSLKKKIVSPIFNKCLIFDSIDNVKEYYLIGLKGQEMDRCKVFYDLDSLGKIITEHYYKENEDTNSQNKFHYFYKIDFLYDKNCKVKYLSENDYDFNNFSETFFKYNSKGYLTSKVKKDSLGIVKESKKIKFDLLRKRVIIKEYEYPKEYNKRKFVYTFKENKKIEHFKGIERGRRYDWNIHYLFRNDALIKTEHYFEQKKEMSSYTTYEYAANGSIYRVQEYYIQPECVILERDRVYSCDLNGNWVKMMLYHEGELTRVVERTIEYR